MATLTLNEAKITGGGRILRMTWSVRPAPASYGSASYRPAILAGDDPITLSGGRTPVFRSVFSRLDFNYPPAYLSVATGTQRLATGCYYARFSLVQGGQEIYLSCLGIGNAADPVDSQNDSIGLMVPNGKTLYVHIPGGVPAGMTANLYLNQNPAEVPSLMRLWKSGIVAGVSVVEIDTATFEDPTRSPPSILGWRADYLIPQGQNLVVPGETVLVNAPVGLLRDRYGNQTGIISSATVKNRSRTALNGFAKTDYGLGAGAVDRYISGVGSDSGDGLSWATAKQTFAGFTAFGNGDRIHVSRGDTFQLSLFKFLGKTGIDFDHPLVMFDDWDPNRGADPGTRPILMNASPGAAPMSWSSNSNQAHNIVISGMHFKFNPAHTTYTTGFNFGSGGESPWLDDCVFEGFGTAIEFGGSTVQGSKPTYYIDGGVHRLIVIDSNAQNTSTHTQGFHSGSHYDLEVSECTFDNNGWRQIDGLVGTQFDHTQYNGQAGRLSIQFGNILHHGSLLGVMMRGGGAIFDCVVLDQGYGFTGGGFGASLYRNVFDDMHTVPTGGSNIAGNFSISTACENNGFMEFNCFLRATTGVGITYSLIDDVDGVTIRMGELIDQNNLYLECGPWMYRTYPARHEQIANIFSYQLGVNNYLIYAADATSHQGYGFREESDYNVFYSPNPLCFQINTGGGSGGLTRWQTATGADVNSVFIKPEFVNESYDKEAWATARGFANWAAMLTALRTRLPGVWSSDYTGEGALEEYGVGLRPTNLTKIDDTPWGFPGFVDFRTESIQYTLLDGTSGTQGNYDAGDTVQLTADPLTVSEETLGVTVSPAPSGTPSVPSITWNLNSNPVTFNVTLTQSATGTVTVNLTRAGVAIATYTITVNEPAPDLPSGIIALGNMTGCLILQVG